MIHLAWDWYIALGIVMSGLLSGYFLGPSIWPMRLANHQRAPYAVALVISIAGWASFFGALAAFRYITGVTIELQATVLNLMFIVAGATGLRFKTP